MDAQEPNYLCALALHVDTLHPGPRNVEETPPQSGELKRAAVLDALARLLVREDNGQAVAVGAGLDDSGHIELYVSEYPAASSLTVAHLRNICTRLIDTRATIHASPDPAAILREVSTPVHLAADTAEPAFASLHALQLSLYSHSIQRIHARFMKDRWPDRLRFALACIKGPPASTRDDLSPDERQALEMLQEYEMVQGYAHGIGRAVQHIQDSIDQGSSYDLNNVREACVILATVVGTPAFGEHMVEFSLFIRAYLTRIGEPPEKMPDMAKWFKEVSFVVTEYRNLVATLTKPALSAMFGNHVAIHSIVNGPPKTAPATKLEVDNILAAFDGFGYNPRNFKDIDGLATEIADAASRTSAGLVHCECLLLCHLDQLGRGMLPYIGVSKAPCLFCDTYFTCYRAHRGFEVHTLRTHGHTADAWMWPDLPGDAPMKVMFCEKLRIDITDMLSVARSQRKAWVDSPTIDKSDGSWLTQMVMSMLADQSWS